MPTNPFSNSRVDNPFQDHIDLDSLNHQQFAQLEAILKDIKNDHNHQTKGTVIIGEAGSGKTHLIMRLAKTHLKSNRLLFIRCPTNPEGVTYHIYSRILESLMEMVDDRYNQLDYLIAKSFSNIWKEVAIQQRQTAISERILKIIEKNPLDIFERLEKSNANIDIWNAIETYFIKWTNKSFNYLNQFILKAFIKQTRYTDKRYKDLIRRYIYLYELEKDELEDLGLPAISNIKNREELALEAIQVLSHLSLMDEPLIIVFDQLESLGEGYARDTLLSFGSALREIFTHIPNSLAILNLFPDRWQYFKNCLDTSIIERAGQSEIILEHPTQQTLEDIIIQRSKQYNIDLSNIFLLEDWQKILIQPTIRSALNCAANYYRLRIEDIPLPIVFKSFEEETKEEIAALKYRINELEKIIFNQQKENIHLITAPTLVLTPQKQLPKVPQITFQSELEHQLYSYLQHRQNILEQHYEKPMIIDDYDDIGKIRTIIENFRELVEFELEFPRLGKRVFPPCLEIQTPHWTVVIGFLQVSGSAFTSRIQNFNAVVINSKDAYFRLFRDIRLPEIKRGTIGNIEIEKLKNTRRCNFSILEKEQRIQLELFYQLISDIINKDQEFPLKETLEFLKTYYKDHFLMKILFGTRRSF